jgi:hypothetical protein
MTHHRLLDPFPLWPLPLATALLFLFAVHTSWLLTSASGQFGWCLPYWLDCTSISATGRQLPGKLVFKPLLTVAATAMALYWGLMRQWLCGLGVGGQRPQYMMWLGVVGALCVIAYTAALGEGGVTALALRRAGAVLGFSLTYLAQLLLTAQLDAGKRTLPVSHWLLRVFWWLVVAMLGIGTASALLEPFDSIHDRIDDGVEWMLMLLLNVHVALTARLWWATRFKAQLGVG